LLKQGIPYNVIEELNSTEINIILGLVAAQTERANAAMNKK